MQFRVAVTVESPAGLGSKSEIAQGLIRALLIWFRVQRFVVERVTVVTPGKVFEYDRAG